MTLAHVALAKNIKNAVENNRDRSLVSNFSHLASHI